MRRNVRPWALLVFLSTIVLTGCGSGNADLGPLPVKLAMGYIPSVQFAPFYVAVEKGFFADEGIEIEFDYGWETDLLKLVGGDELQFAIASGDQVVLARSQGLPVVYLLNWYRRFPVCVVSLQETGILSPADLVGKSIGTPVTFGASYIGWRALLDALDLPESSTSLATIGYTQVAALTERQVDAAICYAMNEPVQLTSAGVDVNVIYVADYANLVSNGLISNDKTVRDKPQLVQGMVRAALKGLAYTIENPDDAFEICLKYVPGAQVDEAARAVNRAVLDESIKFWEAGSGQLGRSELEDWQLSVDVMKRMGLLGAGVDVSSMFTNRFVDRAGH